MTPVVAVGAGRFDAEVAAVVARLHRAAQTQLVYVATEVMAYQWEAIKANLPAGWKAVHLGEYLIAWDHQAMKPVGVKAHWTYISQMAFNRGHIHVRAKVAEIRLANRVDDKHGCYYGIAHLPAHLQDGDDYKSDPKFRDEVKAHQEALATLGRRALRRQRKHPKRRQCLSLDANVDLFRSVWRLRLMAELHLAGAWREGTLPLDHQGDLGRRMVTGVWTYGFGFTNAQVTDSPKVEKGLDHRMVEVFVPRPTA